MDLAVDDQGLWVLWGDTDNACRLYASKIDVYRNTIIHTRALTTGESMCAITSLIFSSYLPIFVGFKVAYYSFFFVAITACATRALINPRKISGHEYKTRASEKRKTPRCNNLFFCKSSE